MQRLFITALVAAFCLSVSAGSAFAFGPGPGGDMKEKYMAYKLLFNEEQNKQLEAVVKESKAQIKPLAKQMHEERQALGKLIKNEASADKDIKAQVDKIAETQYQLALKLREASAKVRKIATKEQLAKIDAFEEQQRAKRDKFRDAFTKVMEQAQPE